MLFLFAYVKFLYSSTVLQFKAPFKANKDNSKLQLTGHGVKLIIL